MKTAEEWAISQWQPCPENQMAHCDCLDKGCKRLVGLIRSAQRDAIEAAAKVAEDRANVSFPRPGAAVYYASIAEAGEIATAIRSLLPPDEASK